VVLYPLFSGKRAAEKRRSSVVRNEPTRGVGVTDRGTRSRREQVETSLKEIEERAKSSKKTSLTARIAQAGLAWSMKQFIIISVVLGGSFFLLAWIFGAGLLPAMGLGFAGGFGLPRWLLGYLKKRREKQFLAALPDAVDT